MSSEMEFSVEEQVLVLLLGVRDRPVPSRLHVQKEVFMLAQVYPKLGRVFDYQAYLKGPFSRAVNDALESLMERGLVDRVPSGYVLTSDGWRVYNELCKALKKKELLGVLGRIRDLYDRLSPDELLLLVYTAYPDYVVESSELAYIVEHGVEIAERLLRKGVITQARYEEILRKVKELEEKLKARAAVLHPR